MLNKENIIEFETPFYQRYFCDSKEGFKTILFKSMPDDSSLFKGHSDNEGIIKLNGHLYVLGGQRDNSIAYLQNRVDMSADGSKRMIVTFQNVAGDLKGIAVKVIYECPDEVPVLIKWVTVENCSDTAIRLDGMQVESFVPDVSGKTSLMLENDYVRGAMKVSGENARSPWIEHQHIYVNDILNPKSEPTVFAYPVELDKWIQPGELLNSFKVYEFIAPTENEELRGIAFRRSTRKLFPWTAVRHLHCALPAAREIEEYYRGIESAADVGYEAVLLCHWWIDRKLTSPLFTNYSDYILRSDLFPNGWEDVKKLTNYAHSKGLEIYFYSIYVNTWRQDDNAPQVQKDNDWLLVWDKDDKSSRWGNTFDPATDWGLYVNRKMEEAVVKGGFDAWHLDGPYYGDINIAENRGCKPGGPNQYLAWERQKEFYQRMRALGIHGEAAQGFCAYPHGMSRITTSGYEEGDFGEMGMKGQILATRKGAYTFTKVYRPEQAATFVPVVPWSPNPDAPSLIPMEENAGYYDAYLAFCFGYGFEGRIFQRVSYEGPKSEAAIRRWLSFWKDHADFFKKGYMLHLREPDGEHIDAIAHYLVDNGSHKLLVVAYNPVENEQETQLKLPFEVVPCGTWIAVSETGEKQNVYDGNLNVTVPALGAVWYEIILDNNL